MQIKKIQRDALFDYISFTIVFVHLTTHLFLFTTTSKANQGYSIRAVGHNALEKTVKRMCSKPGMVGY